MQTKRKNETTMNEREREDERIPFALVAYLPRYNITDLSLSIWMPSFIIIARERCRMEWDGMGACKAMDDDTTATRSVLMIDVRLG
jgi:hypothetical protein